jgi:hypothetical protein
MMRRVLICVLLLLVVGGAVAIWRSTVPEPAAPAHVATTTPERAASAPPLPAPAPTVAEPAAPPEATPRRRRDLPKPAAPVEVAAAAPALGTLHIDSDVPGAQVFIDRRFVGVTPWTETDVAPGAHRVNLVAAGYESLAENVEVVPGPRDLMFKFKEIRLDATLAVVHKHRMGSCRGQLVATPDGLRYETTDKDDTFSIPLANFETFEVDYLAKVLKVRVKRGKRYEFTDPESNADRLFVFHRDVEKVRQRLSVTP